MNETRNHHDDPAISLGRAHPNRRRFLQSVATAGAGMILGGCATQRKQEPARPAATSSALASDENHAGEEEEVSPAEDLMREHGVLKRVLLVYREGVRRMESSAPADLPPEAIAQAARIIRDFIEDYHEKLEEDYLFPRFRKANVQVQLVEVLTTQHQAGRRVTDVTLSLANLAALRNPDDRQRLSDSLRSFIRMYEPHEAREDTVLFPALHQIVSQHEYDSLGEEFEKIEHQRFGEGGFEEMVDRVAAIEKSLGIYDLAQFTP